MRVLKTFCLTLICLSIVLFSASASVDTLLSGWGWKDSDREQSPLGCVITDGIRWAAGTDIALFPGARIRTNLDAGAVERVELDALFFEPEPVVQVTLDGAMLWDLLEEGVSATTMNEDETWNKAASASPQFLQISGFSFEYDLTARMGDRVRVIELADGRSLTGPDAAVTLTAAVPERFAREAIPGAERSTLGFTAADALETYIRAVGILTEPEGVRIRPWGASEETLAVSYRLVPLAVACAVIALLFTLRKPKEATWKQLLEQPRKPN